MNRVGPSAVSYSKDLDFTFTYTLRGEKISLNEYSSYTFVIDIDGAIYQGAAANESSATVILVGGVNKFINSKTIGTPSNYYISEQQKVTLYKVIRGMAEYSDSANITSENPKLEQALNALYTNYCG